MDILKKIWPTPFKIQKKETNPFVVQLIIYVLIGAVVSIVLGVIGGVVGIAWLSAIFSIVSGLVDVYCTGAIVICILRFVGVIKDCE